MKRTFKIVSIVLTIAILFSIMPMAYAVENENAMTLEDFLEENDIMPSDTLEVYVVTDAHDKQYIKTVKHLSDGNIAVNFLACVDEVNGEIVDVKILPNAQANTTIEILPAISARASTPLTQNISSYGITITVTAYYTTVAAYIEENHPMTLYKPSGVTAKWSRTSGSKTVTSMEFYFQLRGDLYEIDGANATLTESGYLYLAHDIVANPTPNVVYSAYESLGTNEAIHPYYSNPVGSSNGISFSLIIDNNETRPVEDDLPFPY